MGATRRKRGVGRVPSLTGKDSNGAHRRSDRRTPGRGVGLGLGDRRGRRRRLHPRTGQGRPGHLRPAPGHPRRHVYTAGELVPFTIQSVSKPFVYALALADSGADAVLAQGRRRADRRPVQHDQPRRRQPAAPSTRWSTPGRSSRRPSWPARTRDEQFDRMLDGLSAFAGRDLAVDEDVFESERDDRRPQPGHRLPDAHRPACSTRTSSSRSTIYFRQCSIVVTARDLAVMAATLANAGVNPVTGVERRPAPRRGTGADRDGHVRHVRLLRGVALPRRPAGQERGERAVAAVLPGQLGPGRPQPAAGPPRQQRARRGGLRARSPSGSACTCCCPASAPARACAAPTAPTPCAPSALRDRRPSASSSTRTGASIAVHELGGDQGFADRGGAGARLVLERPGARRGGGSSTCARVTRIDMAAVTLLAGLIDQLAEQGTVVGPRGAAGASDRARPCAGSARSCSASPTSTPRWSGARPSCCAETGSPARCPTGWSALADQDLLRGLPAGCRGADRGAHVHPRVRRGDRGLRGGRSLATGCTSSAPARSWPTSGCPASGAGGG